MQAIVPTRSLLLLIGIGFIDLFVTVGLYSRGLIVEMNPIMRPILERGEWQFVLVKGATLVAGWWLMATYAKQNLRFVRQTCLLGSAAYVTIWLAAFLGAR